MEETEGSLHCEERIRRVDKYYYNRVNIIAKKTKARIGQFPCIPLMGVDLNYLAAIPFYLTMISLMSENQTCDSHMYFSVIRTIFAHGLPELKNRIQKRTNGNREIDNVIEHRDNSGSVLSCELCVRHQSLFRQQNKLPGDR